MINGSCHTNLDDYSKLMWPRVFSENVAIGHSVKSLSGGRTLKIVNITHCVTKDEHEPYLHIELHLHKQGE